MVEKFFMSDNFRYCPKCGAAALQPNSPKSVLCSACGFEYFFNPAGAVAGLIVNENNELLITVRAQDPHKGKLDLPGGFIDPCESAEEALRREIKEEINLDVEKMEYLASAPNIYHYKQVTYPTIDLAFVCHVSDFANMHAKDDIAEARFLPTDQITPEKFPFPSIRRFIEIFSQ